MTCLKQGIKAVKLTSVMRTFPDEAEKHLKIAVEIRNADVIGPTFDAAFSRENLAVVYEMRGDLVAAKQMRKSTGKFACGNHLDHSHVIIHFPYFSKNLMNFTF